jgi:Transcriptional regulator
MLVNGEIDLGLVEGPFDMSKFCYEKFLDDELLFAVSPQNQFSNRKIIHMEEILESKLILREDGSGTRKVLENKLLELGLKTRSIRPYMEVGSIGAIKSLVELNLGCTIISKAAIQKEIVSGSIVVIPIKDVRILRAFNFIFLKEGPKEFINDFIGYAKK